MANAQEGGPRNKKRQRGSSKGPPSWKDAPAFLDASTSIAVSTFAARRLPELQQLYQPQQASIQPEHVAFESGGGQTSSRHLRRRTTSQKSRRHRHRYPTNPPDKTSTSRRARRSKQDLVCQGHHGWHSASGSSESNPTSIHWMMTHIWHAKRFHMRTLWGWSIPIAHTNRGARAVLRLTTSRSEKPHTTVQDLTYCRQSLRIKSSRQCSKDDLVRCLARILPDWNHDPKITTFRTDSTSNNNNSSSMIIVGEGIIHRVDEFPKGAIGPIVWHVTYEPPSQQWNVDLRVHPSIWTSVRDCVNQLQTSMPLILEWPDPSEITSPLCCFRICGPNATKDIQQFLKPQPCELADDEGNPFSVVGDDTAGVAVPHGTTVKVRMGTKIKDDPKGPNNNEVLLVRHLPRPMDCDANCAVTGWDLYCSPMNAMNIWMALALNCIVIGIVEEMHLQLECEPPLPVFPRDDVDTDASHKYWENTDKEWKFVRTVFEGGWGRLPIQKRSSVKPISMTKLIVPNEELDLDQEQEFDAPNPVVVRGSFGGPFLAALQGCGELTTSVGQHTQDESRSRKRRRPTSVNAIKQAMPLDGEQAVAWHQMVQTLLDNLSLPAVLQAHILLVGQGTIQTGDQIVAGNTCLGVVTAGSFSNSRGVCHGIAVLGAHKFLCALTETGATNQRSGRVVPLRNGKKEIQLVASLVRDPDNTSEITVSLIL